MNAKKILALLLGAMMLLSLAACGAKDDKAADMNGNNTVMTGEAKNAEEALAMHKELMAQENALLSEKTELWEKVFMAADKGMTMQEDGKSYGDFLLKTIEDAKEEFSDEEYEWLKESATEISNIENKLTELEEKYPEIMQKSMDGDMSMPAGSDTSTPPDDGSTTPKTLPPEYRKNPLLYICMNFFSTHSTKTDSFSLFFIYILYHSTFTAKVSPPATLQQFPTAPLKIPPTIQTPAFLLPMKG